MNAYNIYTKRLLKFAKHIESITNHPEHGLYGVVNLIALEERVRIPYKVKYHEWVFEELPAVFESWYFTEKWGDPMWEGCDPAEGTVASVIDFFSLTLDEFSQLFDVEGFQHLNRFGGRILTLESTGADIAYNIVELVSRKHKDTGPGFFPN